MKSNKLGKIIKKSVSSGHGISFEYSLYRSAKKVCGRYSYSIALRQTDENGTEDIFAGDISRTKRSANKIFNLLSEGQVTACAFFEVLEEIL